MSVEPETIRDRFAMSALTALLGMVTRPMSESDKGPVIELASLYAKTAYQLADAMLKARSL